jgi:hypothetical protein
VSEKTEAQWEAEDNARTLMRAEEIRSNKKILMAALRELRKQRKALDKAIE